MITTIFILTLSYFINAICFILPTWQIWPAAFLTGLNYFFSQIAQFNFIFPIDTLFIALRFYISFEVAYFTAKLIMKIFNYFRGAGSGLDI